MRTFFSALILFFCLLGTSLWADDASYEHYYDPYDHVYYDYAPYYNHGVYSTGYYFNPHQAYHGSYEEGLGQHVPTGSVASPYDHGVHHGYHWSEEGGRHRGTHYGHE